MIDRKDRKKRKFITECQNVNYSNDRLLFKFKMNYVCIKNII